MKFKVSFWCLVKMKFKVSFWCLVLAAIFVGVLSQPDSLGFISIDCGLPPNSTYIDKITGLTYVSDAQYIDTGTNHNVSGVYITSAVSKHYYDVRSFPTGPRNCYTLRSLTSGSKYLIRATFMYGDYDGLSKPPIFDLYIGVNFWRRMNISDASFAYIAEVITVVTNNYVQVCLLDKGQGTPFISSLDLRPLNPGLYPAVANSSVSMSLHRRLNAGVDDSVLVRYPADPLDRIWEPFNSPSSWTQVNTTSPVKTPPNDMFQAPSMVMQSGSSNDPGYQIRFYWVIELEYKSPTYFVVMYFAELVPPPSPNPGPDPKKPPKKGSGNSTDQLREFSISINGYTWYDLPIVPQYLMTSEVYGYTQPTSYTQYNLLLQPTDNATLAPILNAVEIFVVLPTADLPTDSGDFLAIMAIRERYLLKKNWTGDPCNPKVLLWTGVTCNYGIATPPRIISLNLSSTGLSGGIATYFSNFTELQSLDLSHNNLTGPIPDFLALLPLLTFLDLSFNQLSGSVPSALQKKSQDGTLTLRANDNGSNGPGPVSGSSPSSSNNSSSLSGFASENKMNKSGVIAGVTVTVVVISLVVLFIVLRKRRRPHDAYVRPRASSAKGNYDEDNSLQLDNRRFTHKELKIITNDFEKGIGKGGFGMVYLGYLEDGTPVAVKMRSESAAQGINEFLGEAQHLIRVHHRNLVSLIGYCKDGEYSALVYEYMTEGTVQDKLRGPAAEAKPMDWQNRLRIGLESAQGLEYLHKACKPPLIHRDVKTNNILLNSKLEAKIADFGLSKAFNNDVHSHISTAVVGTPGYLDPEYYTSYQLSEKSDVYSFGVVLLELVTGQPPIIAGPQGGHVVQWVRQRLSKGDIEDVVDANMQGEYDVNSVWKVADLALRCVSHTSIQRPAMADVVAELKECMELETVNEKGHSSNPSSTTSSMYMRNDNAFTYPSGVGEVSQTYEMGNIVSGPAAR